MNYSYPTDNGDEWERADEEFGFEDILEDEPPKLTPQQKKAIKLQKEKEKFRQQSIESYLFVSNPYHLKDFDSLVELTQTAKQLKSQIDALRTKIKENMIACKCNKAINLKKGYQLTISQPRMTYSSHKEFNMDRFKAENPELYEKYLIKSSNKNWSEGGNLTLKALTEKQSDMYNLDEFSQYFVRPVLPNREGYTPTCPQGYTTCVCDPAYIKFHYPDWYKELYGTLTPEEASKERCNTEDDCYDDEDK